MERMAVNEHNASRNAGVFDTEKKTLLPQQTRIVVVSISMVTTTWIATITITVVTVTSKVVTPTILVCCGYINKTFCWGNKVIFSVDGSENQIFCLTYSVDRKRWTFHRIHWWRWRRRTWDILEVSETKKKLFLFYSGFENYINKNFKNRDFLLFFYMKSNDSAQIRNENVLTLQSKNKTPVSGSSMPGWETKTGVVRISVIFQDRSMFRHISGKLSPRPIKWCGWT